MRAATCFIITVITLFIYFLPSVNSQSNPQKFWADYPACEEQCHESIWAAQQCNLPNNCGCTSSGSSSCLYLADSCLCETSSWLVAVERCIGMSCGAGGVSTAASIAASACSENGYSLAVESTALISYGLAAIATTTTTTTSPTLQPTSISTLISSLSSTTVSGPSSTSNLSSGTPSPRSSDPQPNGIIAAYVVLSVIGDVTIIVMLIIWMWKPEEAKALLIKYCCCCSRQRAKSTSDGTHTNGIWLQNLRGLAQPTP